ncbi:TNF receptor-associated factor 4-like [Glandiceps talaboti]
MPEPDIIEEEEDDALPELSSSGGGSAHTSRRGSATSRISTGSSGSGSSGSMNKMGDFEICFEGSVDKKYECAACCQVLRYPVQFEDCGHRVCSSCLPDLLRVSPRCPIDQTPVSRDRVYVDTPFGKEISNLPVKCCNYTKGCDWAGILQEVKTHMDECGYIMVDCPNICGAHFEKRFLEGHITEDCHKRTVQCDFCEKNVFYKDEIAHMNACKQFPVPCPNGCKETEIPRGEVKNHCDTVCPKAKIPCPFAVCGCDYKGERQKMTKHLKDEPTQHLTLVGETIVKHVDILDEHKETLAEQKLDLVECRHKVQDLEKLYGSQLVWKIDRYAERMQEAKTGKKPTIFSPSFSTSRHGYRLAVSLCLNGDGKAKNHFMSVFVCICRGEYDALLPWPFSHRIVFTLIDQCQDPNARRNLSYQVKPNICKENKPFLGRPSGERNASFGTQRFVPLASVKTLDYIRDDTMFIKVHVDHDQMILL